MALSSRSRRHLPRTAHVRGLMGRGLAGITGSTVSAKLGRASFRSKIEYPERHLLGNFSVKSRRSRKRSY